MSAIIGKSQSYKYTHVAKKRDRKREKGKREKGIHIEIKEEVEEEGVDQSFRSPANIERSTLITCHLAPAPSP